MVGTDRSLNLQVQKSNFPIAKMQKPLFLIAEVHTFFFHSVKGPGLPGPVNFIKKERAVFFYSNDRASGHRACN